MIITEEVNPEKHLVSAPGRTEVAGNHQDHQGGCVLASAIDKRIFCTIYEAPGSLIRVKSEGYDDFIIDINEPNRWTPRSKERQRAIALVRGMCSQLMQTGVNIRGCTLEIRSEIPPGSGLSSSAAFEICVGAAFLALDGWTINFDVDPHTAEGLAESKQITPLHLAQMGLHAERAFFGKPCGIMDQISCAYGGVIHMDFQNRISPIVTHVTLPPSCGQYTYLLVDCGASHEDTTDSFAQVAIDMQTCADAFGVMELRDITMEEYLKGFGTVRAQYGDLVALRGLAFFEEFRLVKQRMKALARDDATRFVELADRSGMVSAEHLQNVGFPGTNEEAMVALALCHAILEDLSQQSGLPLGSARIHGGGFGGTVQVIVPKPDAEAFEERINEMLGYDACIRLVLGSPGVRIHEEA